MFFFKLFFFMAYNLSQHVVTKMQSVIPWFEKEKELFFVWWCGMLFHTILTWDFIYPCHNFKIKKLSSATCDYPKGLKIFN